MIEMLEITPLVDLKIIRETMSRIGVANKKEKVLFPSCYLYEEEGKFFIVHFKQLFTLTRSGSYNNMSEQDYTRRNAVAFCLKNWQLIDVIISNIEPYGSRVFVLPFHEKAQWKINHKFNISLLKSNGELI